MTEKVESDKDIEDRNLECNRCKLMAESVDDFDYYMDVKEKVEYNNDKCDGCNLVVELLNELDIQVLDEN